MPSTAQTSSPPTPGTTEYAAAVESTTGEARYPGLRLERFVAPGEDEVPFVLALRATRGGAGRAG